jgi:hypothetical protein
MVEWLVKNREWVFSGIGVLAVASFLKWWWPRRKRGTQMQSSGAHSTNLQAGGDISINRREDPEERQR